MSLVIKDKEGNRPHLALCHEAQGLVYNAAL